MKDKLLLLYRDYAKYLYGLIFALFSGVIMAKLGVVGGVVILSAPLALIFFYFFFRHPKLGVYVVFILGFWIATLGRYLPPVFPFGLLIDILLASTYIVLILKYWKNVDLSPSYNDVVILMLIWMGYCVLQIANPFASSFMAWFYSMRGVALYQLLCFGLVFTVLNSKKDLYRFIHIWLAHSILGGLWGAKQKIIGLDPFEQAWLDAGAHVTHVLFGKLRHFSYYFDSGNFGAAMGHAGILASILVLGPYSRARKAFYIIAALISFYGMLISGTRGALAVPAAGGVIFLLLTKNVKILVPGAVVILGAYIFLRFTTIGQSNYDINRLRTAVNPTEDASFQVRMQNRAALSAYLSDKPFGTGLGTAGFWGARFSPNTWMAQFQTDGLYTRIRAETGRIGHTIYVWSWLYIFAKGFLIVWNYKDPEKKYLGIAFMAGFGGILLANYGNSVMSQSPISFTCYISIGFVYCMRYWDENGNYKLPKKLKKKLLK